MRDLLNQIETLSEAGETAPNSIVPTHFHKSNIGTSLPLMMTEPGIFWWETSSSEGERGGGGRSIQRWQGNTESRSKWNPASVDGVYVDGKPVEFPEGVTWKTYKPEAVAKPPDAVAKPPEAVAKPPEAVAKPPEAVAKPPEAVKQSTKPTPASNSDHTAKLNALSLQLQDKLKDTKISKPAVANDVGGGPMQSIDDHQKMLDRQRATPGEAHKDQGGTTPTTGKLNLDAKCKMCGNAYKDHFNFEPAGDPNGKVTSTKFRHMANPTDEFFPGLNGTQSTKPEPTDTIFKKADGTPAADPPGGRPPPGVIFNKDQGSELYTIQKGDNLTRLAKKFGTTVPELLKLNPDIKNPNLIITGKDLKIPSGNPVQEGSMATALIESFGYDVELDEYSLNQFGTDVGAGARGIGNGLTFGFGDNMLAGAKAGLGIEKDYKTALGKEMANTARAKANSTSGEFNNPFHDTWVGNKLGVEKTFKVNPYDVGDIVGTVAAPIPGSIAVKGASKAGQLALGVGANVAAAGFASWMKNRHDKSTTGLTQDNVNMLASKPEVLKMVQQKLGLSPTGKISPETLDAIDKAKIFNESKSVPLSESEKMAKLRNTLQRLDEGKGDIVGKLVGKGTGAAEKDLSAWLTKQGVKDADTLVGRQHGLPNAVKDPSSGLIVPSTALKKPVPTKVEPTVTPKVEPTVTPKVDAPATPTTTPNVKNTNTNTNTATGGGGGSGGSVKGSGNSTNNITINIGGKELAAVERAVAQDAGAVVAKELAAVVKTGDKAAIGGWWARNKNKVKWTSGTLGVLSAVGLAGLLWGGKDDAQDMKPSDDPAVTTDPNVPVTTDPNVPVTTDPNKPGPNDKQDTKTDAEVEALIQQMQELMLGHQDDESPAWGQATSNAQSLIDQAKGSKNTAQIALDKEAARRMPASKEVASTKPAADSEQGPQRLGYGDDELDRIRTLSGVAAPASGGYERSNNTKDPIRVAGGTEIGPKADKKIGDYRLDPEGKAKLKAN